ncbi:phosphopyruvate hydratase [Micromonospora echinofusca]|uniref:phosphopyruvate hydratase n=1 Tax=Micromonospora echinofusca TaxID=47858 RepID=UPI001AD60E60|nr:phosphopyruvate hydratase [Micromonospora echinofusca]
MAVVRQQVEPARGTAPVVIGVRGWECLDSRGNPTVGCVVYLEGGVEGVALAPAGASTGRFERPALHDGGARYAGFGARAALHVLDDRVAPALVGRPATDVDGLLDGPSNVTVAVSLAAARARAAHAGLPLWQYLAGPTGHRPTLPCPMVNIFSGGRHAEGGGVVQDYLAVPLAATSFAEAIEQVWDVRRNAAALVEQRAGRLAAVLVADEGGLALSGGDDELPLQLLTDAIERTGHSMRIAIDVAATQVEKPAALLDEVVAWCDRYPVVSIEDPLSDDDWDGWVDATRRLAGRQVVGDDLFATSAERVRRGADTGAGNAVLVKPNQVGTLSGAAETLALARSLGMRTIVSARSGDTEDDAIADLAVGWAAGQIKVGSVTRSERLAKYNRLLRLEEIDRIPYAGWDA